MSNVNSFYVKRQYLPPEWGTRLYTVYQQYRSAVHDERLTPIPEFFGDCFSPVRSAYFRLETGAPPE